MANMKDHFNLVRYMEKENLFGMTEKCMKETFNRDSCMVKEL